ncbi:MAG: transposase, partial [Archangium sp.]|nr:transposase [Archangium sp.]
VRFQVVKQPALLKRLEVRLVQAVWRHQRATAKRLGAGGPLRGGGVCFWQYFGSSLQLTPHLHLLVPEALWTEEGEVVTLPPPDDAQVMALLARVLRQARADWAAADAAWAEDEYEGLRAEALQRPLGLELPASPHRRRRVAVLEGFSLHADTAVHGNDRQGLGRLCRYGARGPVSERRLEKLEDGRYRYTPKKGAAFTVTAAALVKRLVALLPPPNRHLTSFHGVYGPNSRLRPIVMTRPTPPTAPTPATMTPSAPKHSRRRIDWATLHRRTLLLSQRRRPQGLCPAPTCCTVPAVGAAQSPPSTPPARPPRSASSRWACPAARASSRRRPPRLSASSRCSARSSRARLAGHPCVCPRAHSPSASSMAGSPRLIPRPHSRGLRDVSRVPSRIPTGCFTCPSRDEAMSTQSVSGVGGRR